MDKQGARVRLPARSASDFLDRIVVDCPGCGGLAVVTVQDEPHVDPDIAARRMTCSQCATVREQPRAQGVLADPAMGQRPRLQAVTRHGTLVAYNEAHLDYLEAYIAGRLRQEIHAPGGVRNRSVISRLPAWAKSARNRAEILKALQQVRQRLRG